MKVEVTSTTSVSNTVTVLMSPWVDAPSVAFEADDGVLIDGTVADGMGIVDEVAVVLTE